MPYTSPGARVEHVTADQGGTLSSVIHQHLGLPEWFVRELIRFGAVYCCPVKPRLAAELAARMTPAQRAAYDVDRNAGMAIHGRDPRLAIPQRALADVVLADWAYVRVHVHPKRFPAVYLVDWKERILCNGHDFVVINKPPGVQVAGTVDNQLECCLACAAQAICASDPLLVTHRLDSCTEGVVVLAKTRAFVQYFNGLLKRGNKLRKFYRALSAAPPAPGPMLHFVATGQRVKGLPTHTVAYDEEVTGSQRCELDVLQVERVALHGLARALWGEHAHESLLELKTGRTHQIRVQFLAAGTPLLGDTLYAERPPNSALGLAAPASTAVPPPASGALRIIDEPAGGIGLQAFRLELHFFSATGCAGGSHGDAKCQRRQFV
ncbi:hypothetical protein WJX72_001472 [[Myrmecia] bisecta]|uniref:Pseudouridine synthase RsuA/RluA-like domain-containing protein n=1 Tax=[Myrmecia] bisecta TaxID=41462 RepID=A0AAW1Q9P6_9CHLO